MTLVRDIADIIESIAGKNVYFEGDNVGLLLGNPSAQISTAMLCLDITHSVIAEAIDAGAELIISHHPLIFSPIRDITEDTPLGSKIRKLIKNDISVYCAHTNLDFCPQGINDFAARLAGIADPAPMKDSFGRIGTIKPMPARELASKLSVAFQCDAAIIGKSDKLVKKSAIINGAGGGSEEYIDLAVDLGADCLITSEIKHHIAIYAHEKNLALIELPHFSAEYCYMPEFKKLIEVECEKQKLSIKLCLAHETNLKTIICSKGECINE